MAVDESLNALSTTASSNTPAGSDNVGTDLDDHLRDIKKNIRIAAENFQGILNPTGFEGQLHADKSRSASGIVVLRFHDGGAFGDLVEYDTANNNVSAINFAASAVAGSAVNTSDLRATQTAQESATATTLFTTPNDHKYHPNANQGSGNFNAIGTVSVRDSVNVSSITDVGPGQWRINWSTAFNTADYTVSVSGCKTAGILGVIGVYFTGGSAMTATTVDIAQRSQGISGAFADGPYIAFIAQGKLSS